MVGAVIMFMCFELFELCMGNLFDAWETLRNLENKFFLIPYV